MSATLPVLPLAHPLILLPTGRVTLPVSRRIGEALLHLVQQSEDQPIVAAVPLTSPDSSLYEWGTASRIVRLIKPPVRNPKQPYLLSLNGVTRVRIVDDLSSDLSSGIVHLRVEYPTTDGVPSPENVMKFKAAALKLLNQLARDTSQEAKRESFNKVAALVEEVSQVRAAWIADVILSSTNAEYQDKLDFLSAANPDDRLSRATALFMKQSSISEVSKRIAQSVDESLSKQQKEFFLRQQLAAIQRELSNLQRSSSPLTTGAPSSPSEDGRPRSASELDEDQQTEVDELADVKVKIEAMAKDSEERKMAVREWKRLKRIPQGSVEYGVIRNYLEWLVAIPWPGSSTTAPSTSLETLRDRNFLKKTRQQLDADHYGLEQIKKRLIEYLAVVRLKALQADRETAERAVVPQAVVPDTASEDPAKAASRRNTVKGPILLFVGPPGTGKTSLGQSVARALDRPFQRISLGGVRDEAEIRGHRRTYVASGPGSIVQALRKAGRSDPVILLDEIDKIGQSNFHGDPAAALLEVLDPEQNHTFNDHYINVPIDLSQVLFICTSNTLDTISAPLLDRTEIVHLSGYTYDEKMHIARQFLLPKQLKANGLAPEQLTLTDSALIHIATHYTREAGVRSLERAIGGVVRYKAVEWAEHLDGPADDAEKIAKQYKDVVEADELEAILGIARWDAEENEREERRGVVYGLVVTSMGEGGILPVETIAVPGSGQLKLTGSLGDVIKESGELALSWVKRHAYDLCITTSRSQDPLKYPSGINVHLHLPSGAVKKDGPSAGIAMTCALVSLLTGACVPPNIAMTGEITLRGRVGAVGGIKEKVLGAHRANITKVILPWTNRKDVEHDVPLEVRSAMQFAFVRTVEEALEAAFGKGTLGWRPKDVLLESRL
ncbi:Lon protease C-terminal proteolytic domain-containing protein [Irpex rosettiformis]|uniref:Lon protease C-terminal proteolytic domain-containing protein n=1 Tax=Irpex rosettiformis TaxID=378272 RepID=A0ACB8UDL4_9APHY|nr:Lon protease C-terminal proteolytic domain-containing protein [Irpex rosettiformis]